MDIGLIYCFFIHAITYRVLTEPDLCIFADTRKFRHN
ncbi:hypothetical protein ABIE50_000982 [Chitinophaga sp. OAE865]